jgi:polysaccharide chain length determinant protein (PEP-CTERM system associated)
LQLQLKEIPETIEVSSGYIGSGGPPSPIAVRILELEAEIERLLQQYTSEHPDVKAAQRRLDALRAERDADLRAIATGVGGQEEANTSTYSIANKVYEQVKLNLVEVETDIQIMKERLERANERVGRLESRAAQVPEVEAALTRLNRDYTVVKKNHDALLDRRESARLSRARELKAEEVQFRVVEPPVVPTLPSGPPRGLFIIATIVVGIGAGVGVSGLLFVISGAISSVVGLKEQFRVPVFGVVSVVDSLASRRLKPLKVFACFGTLVLLFVACGALLLIEQQYGLANFVPRDLVGTTRWL